MAAVKSFGELILVESVLDALSVMVAGFENVVSIQGTNGFPESAIRLLRQHGVQRLVLLLDGDEPGQQAAVRLKEKISSNCSAIWRWSRAGWTSRYPCSSSL